MAEGNGTTVRYEAVVGAVGAMVPDFREKGIVVFFADNAPAELHDFAVLHRPQVEAGGIRAGDVLHIGDQQFPLLAVGDVADHNLTTLGHMDLKANGLTDPPMPGDVCVPEGPLPEITVGTRWRIEAAQEAVR